MIVEKQKAILCVYLLCIRDNKVLMARRRNTSYLNGYFTVPTGHVDVQIINGKHINEKASTAVIRETLEETGLIVTEDDFELILTQIKPSNDVIEPRICLYFKIKNWKNEPQNTEPEKAELFDFYPLDNLPAPLLPELESALTAIEEKRTFDEFGWN